MIPSDIHLELGQPYYVAASVDVDDNSPDGVTFYVKKLSGGEAEPLQVANVKHEVVRDYRPDYALNLGGRHGSDRHYWDGLLDHVRLSSGVLPKESLLISDPEAAIDSLAGDWRFDGDAQATVADHSPRNNDISIKLSNMDPGKSAAPSTSALVDFCHVLLNSNEFLYVD